jgi:cytochrome c2
LLTLVLALSLAACRDTSKLQGGGGGGATGNVNNGKTLFASKGCPTCHHLTATGASGTIGPDLDGIAARGATRKAPMAAADYIDESIKDPAAFVVPGFPAPNQGGMILPVPVSDAERKDLVAFLLEQK